MRSTKFLAMVAAGSLAVLGSTGAFADQADTASKSVELTRDQQKLANILEGLEAGTPINCLRVTRADHTRVIDKTAIVYRSGDKIYVNYTNNPRQLDDRDIMVSRRILTQLCKSDIINTVAGINGVTTGNVVLTQFIPYTKP